MSEKMSFATRMATSLNLEAPVSLYLVTAIEVEHARFMQQHISLDVKSSRSIMSRLFSPRSRILTQNRLVEKQKAEEDALKALTLYEESFIKTDTDRIFAMQIQQAAEDLFFNMNLGMQQSWKKRDKELIYNWRDRWAKKLAGSSFSTTEH